MTGFLAVVAFLPMLAESARSTRNERVLRAAGAVEPAGDVFAAMRLVYPACFVAMILESWMAGAGVTTTGFVGGAVFCGAKALKYWAIQTLGERWTFRVLVPPRSRRTIAGPYRFVQHPNYVAVAGELTGFALLAGAYRTGAASLLLFGILLVARIRVEERALGLRTD